MAGQPRYKELADTLRRDIAGGAFRDGGFPTEAELCNRFKVSRFTVREALRELKDEGLIARRRGSGTTIRPAAIRGGALHQPLTNVGEILQYARDTSATFALIGEGGLPDDIADQIGMEAGGRWTRFHGVRSAGDGTPPIASTCAYIAEDLADAAQQVDPSQSTIFRQIEALTGVRIAEVTQDIQAVGAPDSAAAELGIEAGSACLRIIRCYRDAKGRTLEISVSHHPADRFAYSMHIEVEG